MMSYSALEMLYATHIIEGKRTIESVPLSIREDVAEIVTNAKKPEETK
ncbi:CD1375 family protein [Enterococcus sp.]